MRPHFKARFLFYMHATSPAPPDIRFTLHSLDIQDDDGTWMAVLGSPMEISSKSLVKGQIFLAEALLDARKYKAVRFKITKATTRGIDLVLPSDGELIFPMGIAIEKGESIIISIAWDPDESVEKGVFFKPSLVVGPESPSPSRLLIYVANSGSNYISVIDRSLERVVDAITVDDAPKGIVLSHGGERLYVLNTISGTISVIDTSQNRVFEKIQLVSGIEPVEIAVYPDLDNDAPGYGKIYIINRGSNDVTVIDISTKRLLKTIPVGLRPSSIAIDIDRRAVYVANEISNTLSIISTTTDSVIKTVVVEDRPAGIFTDTDNVYVFNEGSNRISVVSKATYKVLRTINTGYGPKRGIVAFNTRLFVTSASGNALIFLTHSGAITRKVPMEGFPLNLVADEERFRIYITAYNSNKVYIVEPNAEKILKVLYVGKNPYGIVALER